MAPGARSLPTAALLGLVVGIAAAPISRADGAHSHEQGGAEVTSAGPETWEGRELVLDLTDAGTAPTFQVRQGESVRLEVRTDRDLALHLHGYDLEATAAPGHPAVLTFAAEHGGRFALVAHGEADLLGRSETPLAYLEVR